LPLREHELVNEVNLVAHDEHNLQDMLLDARKSQIYVRRRDNAHFQMALKLHRRERLLGIPVVILSAVVGTAIFATLQTNTSITWQIATGLLSVTAGVLAALQTFFSFAREGERHEAASALCARLWRRLQIFILTYESGEFSRAQCLEEYKGILSEMDQLDASDRPRISTKEWEATARTSGEETTKGTRSGT
jgi:hypothetical protein